MKKSCIILFIKYPEPGKVKTRLANSLGSDLAVNLYKCFVIDILNTLKNVNSDLKIFYSPCSKLEKFKKWLNDNYDFICQDGENLGIRMDNAFKLIFSQGYKKGIILGSDIPGINSSDIMTLINRLNNKDAVIGPSDDGGYNLLGINRSKYISEIFALKSWSHDTVFEDTVKIFKKNNISFSISKEIVDIDYETDLKKFYLKTLHNTNLETIKYILNNRDCFKWII